MNVAKRRVMGQ